MLAERGLAKIKRLDGAYQRLDDPGSHSTSEDLDLIVRDQMAKYERLEP